MGGDAAFVLISSNGGRFFELAFNTTLGFFTGFSADAERDLFFGVAAKLNDDGERDFFEDDDVRDLSRIAKGLAGVNSIAGRPSRCCAALSSVLRIRAGFLLRGPPS